MAVTSRLNSFWVLGILVSMDSSTQHIMSNSFFPIKQNAVLLSDCFSGKDTVFSSCASKIEMQILNSWTFNRSDLIL